ncbi:MAG: hypothetical protein QNJ97_16015 [Myxococcota bacterium]|nr:hypothetical protein [Myxococcota bacterium]
MRIIFAMTIVLLLVFGCVQPQSTTVLRKSGLYHTKCDLVIDLKKRKKYLRNWRIENWAYQKHNKKYVRRGTDIYKIRLYLDLNGDGKRVPYEVYEDDLLLKNKLNPGTIWIRTFELPRQISRKKLEVFLKYYAGSLSGARTYLKSGPLGVTTGDTNAYATKINDVHQFSFGGWKAIAATVEIADIAQLRLDPEHREGYIRVIFVKIPNFDQMYGVKEVRYRPSGRGLAMFAYFNSPEFYEASLDDFYALLSRAKVENHRIGNLSQIFKKQSQEDAPSETGPEENTDQSAEGIAQEEASPQPVLEASPEVGLAETDEQKAGEKTADQDSSMPISSQTNP